MVYSSLLVELQAALSLRTKMTMSPIRFKSWRNVSRLIWPDRSETVTGVLWQDNKLIAMRAFTNRQTMPLVIELQKRAPDRIAKEAIS